MKDLKTVVLVLTTLFLCNLTAISQEVEEVEEEEEVIEETEITQESETIEAVFDGYEEEIYSFNFTNEDGDSDSIFFNKITPEALSLYNLKDKKFIGKTFEITFSEETETEIDDDGDEQELIIRTITNLKPKK
ncbi:hypothetical protein [Aquimarina sp. SS2-1]|uniref:hypothetical protein n=1 Tax=Aquimarina besae TaxID=3342247 RepID=UPI00366B414C